MRKHTTMRSLGDRFSAIKARKSAQNRLLDQSKIPGLFLPGFSGRYQSSVEKFPLGRPKNPLFGRAVNHPDPCFWNRGGGRWKHTLRRGGQLGRQRDRALAE